MVESLRGKGAVHIACGAANTFVITEDGSLYSFGDNRCGALGLGHRRSPQYSPARVPLDAQLADPSLFGRPRVPRFVSAGNRHTLLLASTGEVLSAGDNSLGQCGLEDPREHTQFTVVQHPML